MKHAHPSSHHGQLLVMLALSYVSMFALMYAMVNSFANVYVNANQAYMAALMTAPMAIIELGIMRAMYRDRRLNSIILAAGVTAALGSWLLIRQQIGITDAQFLRSMIPHHAGAILMCEKAPIEDLEIRQLCKNIISSQQTEITQMKAKLNELAVRKER